MAIFLSAVEKSINSVYILRAFDVSLRHRFDFGNATDEVAV